jgi:GDP/UDP-N,N'-diacetylbacillosamine 2-epimerase (hydrolysing)
MMKKKICVVSGSRADFGLLKILMKKIKLSEKLKLQIIATGMHLSHDYGYTYKEIENEGFTINEKVVSINTGDNSVAVLNSIAKGISGISIAVEKLKPDLMLVLGDRYEILAAGIVAMMSKIPLAHIHGGEITEGAIDDSIRHSITKMSHFHFVASEVYRKRVLQLGEEVTNVFNVGGLGVDAIKNTRLLSKSELESELGFSFGSKNLLVTFHPVTNENNSSKKHIVNLLKSLEKHENIRCIFTMPNSDQDNKIISTVVNQFVLKHNNHISFKSLGQKKYLSCLQFVDGVIGNSSSGLLEAPSFNIGTINIGERQTGRLKADSVIDCQPDSDSISSALSKLFSLGFQNILKNITNPYGDGNASAKILKILENRSFNISSKNFKDIKFSEKHIY